jgi:hypothetical protein
MAMNFFDWVRVGVKRSVMAGFADAVETIGVPPEEGQQTQQLLESLRGSTAALVAQPVGKQSNQRKRLGRSISNLRPNEGTA